MTYNSTVAALGRLDDLSSLVVTLFSDLRIHPRRVILERSSRLLVQPNFSGQNYTRTVFQILSRRWETPQIYS